MQMAETFTVDIVTREIKSCINSEAFGPVKLSLFHLKISDLQRLSISPSSSNSLSQIVISRLYRRLH